MYQLFTDAALGNWDKMAINVHTFQRRNFEFVRLKYKKI